MAKTKEIRDKINELESQLINERKQEDLDKRTTEMRNLYLSLVRSGFSEQEAWEIFMVLIENAAKQ